jgi:hypothetical protein
MFGFILAFILAAAKGAAAQGNPTGTLSGHVDDQAGLAVPGATVTAASPALQTQRMDAPSLAEVASNSHDWRPHTRHCSANFLAGWRAFDRELSRAIRDVSTCEQNRVGQYRNRTAGGKRERQDYQSDRTWE